MKTTRLLKISLGVFVVGCSTKPTFAPEVEGVGVISSHGGVVYSIPPQDPVLKMKLVSMVIPRVNGLHVRMYFIRKDNLVKEYLDPNEQYILLPDSSIKIYPESVRPNSLNKQVINLDAAKQAVELVFRLPGGEPHGYEFIKLNWKIHYKKNGEDQIMEKAERFNYVQTVDPTNNNTKSDNDGFPSGNGPFSNEWLTPGWSW